MPPRQPGGEASTPIDKALDTVERAGRTVGKTAARGIKEVGDTAAWGIRGVGGTFRRLGMLALRHEETKTQAPTPGAAPGMTAEQLAALPPCVVPTSVCCLAYGPEAEHESPDADPAAVLGSPAGPGVVVRWLDVQGLGDRQKLASLATALRLHPLILEDVLNLGQRPKIEPVPEQPSASGEASGAGPPAEMPVDRFLVVRMVHEEADRLVSEQISLLVGPGLLVSVQQAHGDPFDPIRRRIDNAGSLLRRHDSDFLLYALLDAIVDFYFPAAQRYVERIDALEAEVFHGRGAQVLEAIHVVRHELMVLRNDLAPTRDVVAALRRGDGGPIEEDTRLYLGDVQDHAVRALELIEATRDRAGALADTYVSVVSNRMNEVMKVLTIIGSIFIPLGFLAGVYGMNFSLLPGAGQQHGFWWFLGACFVIAGGMLAWFRHKRWL